MIRLKAIVLLLLTAVIISCSKKSNPGGNTGGPVNPPVVVPVTPLISLPQGWKVSTTLAANFPAGIQVFTFDSLYSGRKVKAFCVAYDSKNTSIEFKPVISAAAKKPSEFYAQEAGIVYACINAGFFGGNQSFSLVKYNNTVSSANIKVVNRTFNGVSTPYYPTRAAFGISSTGIPSVAWVYSIGAGNNNIFSYTAVSPNAEGTAPQPVPDENFPAGGTVWNTVSAIGGSPMLLRASNVTITDVQELISINNTTSRPRSAIGYNANGIVMLLAVEGDNTTGGYAGLNLNELANLLKDLSCTDAINLDGGGSTSLVIGNQLTVRPGDGTERPVVSALVIKRK